MTVRAWVFCAVCFLSIASIIFLFYFGFTIVKPYVITSDYNEAQCTAVNVTEHGYVDCDCGSDDDETCSSVFPCVEITVIFQPNGSRMYQRSKIFKIFTHDFQENLCFVRPCHQTPSTNRRSVADAIRQYGNTDNNVTYACLYNPKNPTEVIVERPSKTAVIMAMLWPSFVVLVCAVVIVVSFCTLSYRGFHGLSLRSTNTYVS